MMTMDSKDLVHFFKQQIDIARERPAEIITRLQNRKFINELQYQHSQLPSIHYKVVQGMPAVQQAIHALESSHFKSTLQLSESLCETAYQIGVQLAKYRIIDHPQQYEPLVSKELAKTGAQQKGHIEMIIQYGFRRDTQIIPSIIVSDGDKTRANRNILLSDLMNYVGISIHEHSQYDYMLVILLSNFVKENTNCKCAIF